jgi:release factor glutamine methyltransferase
MVNGNLLSSLPERALLIVANLPYIPTAELATVAPELAFEPRAALDGGLDGLEVIRAFLREARGHVLPGTWLLLECGVHQASTVATYLVEQYPGADVSLRQDYAAIDRFVVGRT